MAAGGYMLGLNIAIHSLRPHWARSTWAVFHKVILTQVHWETRAYQKTFIYQWIIGCISNFPAMKALLPSRPTLGALTARATHGKLRCLIISSGKGAHRLHWSSIVTRSRFPYQENIKTVFNRLSSGTYSEITLLTLI